MKMRLTTKTHFKDLDAVTMPENIVTLTLEITRMHMHTQTQVAMLS